MKILMLTDRMDAGGAETHIASLSLALLRRGEEVTVLSAGGRMADRLEAAGVRVERTPPFTRSPLRLLRILLQLRTLVKKEQFDVLHAHARLPALLLRLLPRSPRRIRVVTVHARFSPLPPFRRLFYWGEHTVAVSEDLRVHTALAFSVPYGRIRVIPNGIDLAAFPLTERSEAVGRRILFASRLDGDCSTGARLLCSVLPRLARRFPDVTLTVAGGGSAYGEIAARAARTNRILARPAVTLTGHSSDVQALYATHGILVGVARTAMEGAASGCAVILCGDEGYLGFLDREKLPSALQSNLTCRGEKAPTAEALLRDLSRLLSDPSGYMCAARATAEEIRKSCNLLDTAAATLSLYRSALSKKEKTLLIGGYYGCKNLGDDAILLGTHAYLSEISPATALTALSGKGRADSARLGVPCVRRTAPVAVARAMKKSDAFLCGGGSLLQNKTSNRSLCYYLALLRLSHTIGTPAVLYAAGVGPLRGAWAKKAVARTLGLCARLSLRDPDSGALLSSLGVTAPVFLGADPALLYPHPSHLLRTQILSRHSVRSPYFCVAIRGGSKNTEAVCAAASALVRQGLFPVLLVLDRRADAAVSASLAARLSAPAVAPDVDGLLALLSGAVLTLTERLHAMILSSSVSTPAVGISDTDPKLSSFAALSGQRMSSPDALAATAKEILAHAELVRGEIAARTETLRKKAQKDLANLLGMLYNIERTNGKDV